MTKLKKEKNNKNSTRLYRYITQVFFFVVISFIAIRHQILGGKEAAAVDAYCPFGAVESFITWFTTGNMLPRIQLSAFLIFGALVLTIIIANKGFCGWICPFGSFQEWIGMIAKKLKIPQLKVNGKADGYLRYLKYAVLIVVIYFSAKLGALVFRDYDPFISLFHFGEGLIIGEFEIEKLAAYSVLGIVVVGSFFIERFWCKYACPLGAGVNIFSKLSPIKISRDKNKCIDCSICNKNCPMNVEIMRVDKVKSAECIDCLTCIEKCPKKALDLSMEVGK